MLQPMKSDLPPTTLCAWCGNVIQRGGPQLNHGMCLSCADGVLSLIERMERAQLAAGDSPVTAGSPLAAGPS